MNMKEVKDLIQEILQSDINEFELEHTGTKIRLRRAFATNNQPTPPAPDVTPAIEVHPHRPTPDVRPAPPTKPVEPEEEETLHIITSPIVGTFYRAPSPGAEPYVRMGDTVEEGSILCLVEAMKLMNEIPSDTAGEVVRIFVENSHPVEFGQKLFGIRPLK